MSSSSPEKYTRKWYLNRLCKSIFGKVRIGFEAEDGIPCKEKIISPDVDKAINLQKENENKLLEVS